MFDTTDLDLSVPLNHQTPSVLLLPFPAAALFFAAPLELPRPLPTSPSVCKGRPPLEQLLPQLELSCEAIREKDMSPSRSSRSNEDSSAFSSQSCQSQMIKSGESSCVQEGC